MLTSTPVLATIFVCVTHNWFYGVLLSKMSVYMITVLGLNLEQVMMMNVNIPSLLCRLANRATMFL